MLKRPLPKRPARPSVGDLFASGGPLASARPGYRERPQQVDLAGEVATTFRTQDRPHVGDPREGEIHGSIQRWGVWTIIRRRNRRAVRGPPTPSRAPFGKWLDQRTRGGRLGKDRSGPAISSAYYEVLDEVRRDLGEGRGYSLWEISYGNLAEIAVYVLRKHVFHRESAGHPTDVPPTGGRGDL